jgi:hypothetical protein
MRDRDQGQGNAIFKDNGRLFFGEEPLVDFARLAHSFEKLEKTSFPLDL